MRITISQLRRIIKEEVSRASRPRRSLRESGGRGDEMVKIKNKYTGEPMMTRRSDLPEDHPEYAPLDPRSTAAKGSDASIVDAAYYVYLDDAYGEVPTVEDLAADPDVRAAGLTADDVRDLISSDLKGMGYRLKGNKVFGPE